MPTDTAAPERWSTEQVGAVSPDPASLRNAQKLSSPAKWEGTGMDDGVLWGLCKGSGKNPYQVCVDVGADPAYKCSCPSRKFPCKHALGLLLLWASGAGLGEDESPAYVGEWRSRRQATATRAVKKAEDKAAGITAPADPAAAARRVAQREERVAGGVAELARWLSDQVQQGLAGAETAGRAPYDTMAARLVDAQAPTAAAAVRRLGDVAGVGPHWSDRLLGELGLLQLLVRGHERLAELPADVADTVRSRIGFPVSADDVLAGPRTRDRWLVLGRVEVTDESGLQSRRTWLHGAGTGRFALLLSFAPRGQALGADPVPGTEVDADVCFYPGVRQLRALIAERHAEKRSPERHTASATLREALAAASDALAADPWRSEVPVLVDGLVPGVGEDGLDGYLVDATGEAVPLAPGHRESWTLLAATGGEPTTIAGEWSHAGLRPLSAWVDGRFGAVAPGRVEGGGDPELPGDLLATALVGTGRRPFTSGSVVVGDRTLTVAGASGPAGVLDAAAAALVYARAGAAPEPGHTRTDASPEETLRPLPAAAVARLESLLGRGAMPGHAETAQALYGQWVAAAAERGFHAPGRAVPQMLSGPRSGFAPELARVVGNRGAWLAGVNPAWRWVLGEMTTDAPQGDVWATGTSAERAQHLQELRRADPAAAVALLDAGWKKETGEDRERFLDVLAEAPDPGDDAFVEKALTDRRGSVRLSAVRIAQRLAATGSLGTRMVERATALASLDDVGELKLSPPAEIDKGLERDGAEHGRRYRASNQAWAVEVILAGTPLDHWVTAFGRPPAQVVALADGHPWDVPVLNGWIAAAAAQGDAAWAEALVSHLLSRGASDVQWNTGSTNPTRHAARLDTHVSFWRLVRLLPAAAQHRLVVAEVKRGAHQAADLLPARPEDWTDELAAAVLDLLASDRTGRSGGLTERAGLTMPTSYRERVRAIADQQRVRLDAADQAERALHGSLDKGAREALHTARQTRYAVQSAVTRAQTLHSTLTFRHEMLQEFA